MAYRLVRGLLPILILLLAVSTMSSPVRAAAIETVSVVADQAQAEQHADCKGGHLPHAAHCCSVVQAVDFPGGDLAKSYHPKDCFDLLTRFAGLATNAPSDHFRPPRLS